MPAGKLRGFSHDEPVAVDYKKTFPRLLYTKKSAENALSAWLQGKWKRQTNYYGGFEGPEVDIVVDEVPGRRKEDMEIVVYSTRKETK